MLLLCCTTIFVNPYLLFTLYSKCGKWAREGECSGNPDWMLPNCPVSCGSCNSLCHDYHPRCHEWATKGECDHNAAYMTSYCKKSCQCDPPAYDSAAECKDIATECGYWKGKGRCDDENENFKEYMIEYCKKTCGLC